MVISFMSRFNRFFHERHLDTMLQFVGEGVHIVLVSVFFRLCLSAQMRILKLKKKKHPFLGSNNP